MKPYIVNIGLPRTGTTSFHTASRFLGLRSMHVWSRAELNPSVLRNFQSNAPRQRKYITQFDALSDTPFFVLRETFEKYYPETTIIYTTRPKKDWIKSMLNYKTAGGEFFQKYFSVKNYPFTEKDQNKLEDIYDQHHDETCKGLEPIKLQCPDSDLKWRLMCSCIPNSGHLHKKTAGRDWPHENQHKPEQDL